MGAIVNYTNSIDDRLNIAGVNPNAKTVEQYLALAEELGYAPGISTMDKTGFSQDFAKLQEFKQLGIEDPGYVLNLKDYDVEHKIDNSQDAYYLTTYENEEAVVDQAFGYSDLTGGYNSVDSYINPFDPEVLKLVNSLYDQKILTSDMSQEKKVATLYNYVIDNFSYISEDKDNWNFASETISQRGGDCEDLSILLVSAGIAMLMNEGVSYQEANSRFCAVAGTSATYGDHVYVEYTTGDGEKYIMDPSMATEGDIGAVTDLKKASEQTDFTVYFRFNDNQVFGQSAATEYSAKAYIDPNNPSIQKFITSVEDNFIFDETSSPDQIVLNLFNYLKTKFEFIEAPGLSLNIDRTLQTQTANSANLCLLLMNSFLALAGQLGYNVQDLGNRIQMTEVSSKTSSDKEFVLLYTDDAGAVRTMDFSDKIVPAQEQLSRLSTAEDLYTINGFVPYDDIKNGLTTGVTYSLENNLYKRSVQRFNPKYGSVPDTLKNTLYKFDQSDLDSIQNALSKDVFTYYGAANSALSRATTSGNSLSSADSAALSASSNGWTDSKGISWTAKANAATRRDIVDLANFDNYIHIDSAGYCTFDETAFESNRARLMTDRALLSAIALIQEAGTQGYNLVVEALEFGDGYQSMKASSIIQAETDYLIKGASELKKEATGQVSTHNSLRAQLDTKLKDAIQRTVDIALLVAGLIVATVALIIGIVATIAVKLAIAIPWLMAAGIGMKPPILVGLSAAITAIPLAQSLSRMVFLWLKSADKEKMENVDEENESSVESSVNGTVTSAKNKEKQIDYSKADDPIKTINGSIVAQYSLLEDASDVRKKNNKYQLKYENDEALLKIQKRITQLQTVNKALTQLHSFKSKSYALVKQEMSGLSAYNLTGLGEQLIEQEQAYILEEFERVKAVRQEEMQAFNDFRFAQNEATKATVKFAMEMVGWGLGLGLGFIPFSPVDCATGLSVADSIYNTIVEPSMEIYDDRDQIDLADLYGDNLDGSFALMSSQSGDVNAFDLLIAECNKGFAYSVTGYDQSVGQSRSDIYSNNTISTISSGGSSSSSSQPDTSSTEPTVYTLDEVPITQDLIDYVKAHDDVYSLDIDNHSLSVKGTLSDDEKTKLKSLFPASSSINFSKFYDKDQYDWLNTYNSDSLADTYNPVRNFYSLSISSDHYTLTLTDASEEASFKDWLDGYFSGQYTQVSSSGEPYAVQINKSLDQTALDLPVSISASGSTSSTYTFTYTGGISAAERDSLEAQISARYLGVINASEPYSQAIAVANSKLDDLWRLSHINDKIDLLAKTSKYAALKVTDINDTSLADFTKNKPQYELVTDPTGDGSEGYLLIHTGEEVPAGSGNFRYMTDDERNTLKSLNVTSDREVDSFYEKAKQPGVPAAAASSSSSIDVNNVASDVGANYEMMYRARVQYLKNQLNALANIQRAYYIIQRYRLESRNIIHQELTNANTYTLSNAADSALAGEYNYLMSALGSVSSREEQRIQNFNNRLDKFHAFWRNVAKMVGSLIFPIGGLMSIVGEVLYDAIQPNAAWKINTSAIENGNSVKGGVSSQDDEYSIDYRDYIDKTESGVNSGPLNFLTYSVLYSPKFSAIQKKMNAIYGDVFMNNYGIFRLQDAATGAEKFVVVDKGQAAGRSMIHQIMTNVASLNLTSTSQAAISADNQLIMQKTSDFSKTVTDLCALKQKQFEAETQFESSVARLVIMATALIMVAIINYDVYWFDVSGFYRLGMAIGSFINACMDMIKSVIQYIFALDIQDKMKQKTTKTINDTKNKNKDKPANSVMSSMQTTGTFSDDPDAQKFQLMMVQTEMKKMERILKALQNIYKAKQSARGNITSKLSGIGGAQIPDAATAVLGLEANMAQAVVSELTKQAESSAEAKQKADNAMKAMLGQLTSFVQAVEAFRSSIAGDAVEKKDENGKGTGKFEMKGGYLNSKTFALTKDKPLKQNLRDLSVAKTGLADAKKQLQEGKITPDQYKKMETELNKNIDAVNTRLTALGIDPKNQFKNSQGAAFWEGVVDTISGMFGGGAGNKKNQSGGGNGGGNSKPTVNPAGGAAASGGGGSPGSGNNSETNAFQQLNDTYAQVYEMSYNGGQYTKVDANGNKTLASGETFKTTENIKQELSNAKTNMEKAMAGSAETQSKGMSIVAKTDQNGNTTYVFQDGKGQRSLDDIKKNGTPEEKAFVANFEKARDAHQDLALKDFGASLTAGVVTLLSAIFKIMVFIADIINGKAGDGGRFENATSTVPPIETLAAKGNSSINTSDQPPKLTDDEKKYYDNLKKELAANKDVSVNIVVIPGDSAEATAKKVEEQKAAIIERLKKAGLTDTEIGSITVKKYINATDPADKAKYELQIGTPEGEAKLKNYELLTAPDQLKTVGQNSTPAASGLNGASFKISNSPKITEGVMDNTSLWNNFINPALTVLENFIKEMLDQDKERQLRAAFGSISAAKLLMMDPRDVAEILSVLGAKMNEIGASRNQNVSQMAYGGLKLTGGLYRLAAGVLAKKNSSEAQLNKLLDSMIGNPELLNMLNGFKEPLSLNDQATMYALAKMSANKQNVQFVENFKKIVNTLETEKKLTPDEAIRIALQLVRVNPAEASNQIKNLSSDSSTDKTSAIQASSTSPSSNFALATQEANLNQLYNMLYAPATTKQNVSSGLEDPAFLTVDKYVREYQDTQIQANSTDVINRIKSGQIQVKTETINGVKVTYSVVKGTPPQILIDDKNKQLTPEVLQEIAKKEVQDGGKAEFSVRILDQDNNPQTVRINATRTGDQVALEKLDTGITLPQNYLQGLNEGSDAGFSISNNTITIKPNFNPELLNEAINNLRARGSNNIEINYTNNQGQPVTEKLDFGTNPSEAWAGLRNIQAKLGIANEKIDTAAQRTNEWKAYGELTETQLLEAAKSAQAPVPAIQTSKSETDPTTKTFTTTITIDPSKCDSSYKMQILNILQDIKVNEVKVFKIGDQEYKLTSDGKVTLNGKNIQPEEFNAALNALTDKPPRSDIRGYLNRLLLSSTAATQQLQDLKQLKESLQQLASITERLGNLSQNSANLNKAGGVLTGTGISWLYDQQQGIDANWSAVSQAEFTGAEKYDQQIKTLQDQIAQLEKKPALTDAEKKTLEDKKTELSGLPKSREEAKYQAILQSLQYQRAALVAKYGENSPDVKKLDALTQKALDQLKELKATIQPLSTSPQSQSYYQSYYDLLSQYDENTTTYNALTAKGITQSNFIDRMTAGDSQSLQRLAQSMMIDTQYFNIYYSPEYEGLRGAYLCKMNENNKMINEFQKEAEGLQDKNIQLQNENNAILDKYNIPHGPEAKPEEIAALLESAAKGHPEDIAAYNKNLQQISANNEKIKGLKTEIGKLELLNNAYSDMLNRLGEMKDAIDNMNPMERRNAVSLIRSPAALGSFQMPVLQRVQELNNQIQAIYLLQQNRKEDQALENKLLNLNQQYQSKLIDTKTYCADIAKAFCESAKLPANVQQKIESALSQIQSGVVVDPQTLVTDLANNNCIPKDRQAELQKLLVYFNTEMGKTENQNQNFKDIFALKFVQYLSTAAQQNPRLYFESPAAPSWDFNANSWTPQKEQAALDYAAAYGVFKSDYFPASSTAPTVYSAAEEQATIESQQSGTAQLQQLSFEGKDKFQIFCDTMQGFVSSIKPSSTEADIKQKIDDPFGPLAKLTLPTEMGGLGVSKELLYYLLLPSQANTNVPANMAKSREIYQAMISANQRYQMAPDTKDAFGSLVSQEEKDNTMHGLFRQYVDVSILEKTKDCYNDYMEVRFGEAFSSGGMSVHNILGNQLEAAEDVKINQHIQQALLPTNVAYQQNYAQNSATYLKNDAQNIRTTLDTLGWNIDIADKQKLLGNISSDITYMYDQLLNRNASTEVDLEKNINLVYNLRECIKGSGLTQVVLGGQTYNVEDAVNTIDNLLYDKTKPGDSFYGKLRDTYSLKANGNVFNDLMPADQNTIMKTLQNDAAGVLEKKYAAFQAMQLDGVQGTVKITDVEGSNFNSTEAADKATLTADPAGSTHSSNEKVITGQLAKQGLPELMNIFKIGVDEPQATAVTQNMTEGGEIRIRYLPNCINSFVQDPATKAQDDKLTGELYSALESGQGISITAYVALVDGSFDKATVEFGVMRAANQLLRAYLEKTGNKEALNWMDKFQPQDKLWADPYMKKLYTDFFSKFPGMININITYTTTDVSKYTEGLFTYDDKIKNINLDQPGVDTNIPITTPNYVTELKDELGLNDLRISAKKTKVDDDDPWKKFGQRRFFGQVLPKPEQVLVDNKRYDVYTFGSDKYYINAGKVYLAEGGTFVEKPEIRIVRANNQPDGKIIGISKGQDFIKFGA